MGIRLIEPAPTTAAPTRGRIRIIEPAKPKRGDRRGPVEEVAGALANFNRGTGVLDELAAGMATAVNTGRDVAAGRFKMGPASPQGLNPVAPIISGLKRNYLANLAAQRQVEDDFAARRPNVAAVARGTGMASTALVPAGSAATAPTRLVGAMRGATVAATQAAAYGLADRGTARERLDAAGRSVLPAMALGAAAGALAPTASRAKPPTRKAPTVESLRAQRTAAYRAVDDAGVRYSPDAFDSLITGMSDEARSASISPLRTPNAASMLADVEAMRGTSPSITDLDLLRQTISRDVAGATAKSERFFGRKMIQNIDEFIAAAGPDQVVAGSAPDAARLINTARDLHTRLSKIDAVGTAVEKARLRAGSTGSGGNVNNAIRQNLRGVLERTRNLTPEEKAAMTEIVMGSRAQNMLRQVGKLSPSGNGLMAAGNLASAASFGPLGAVPGAVGMASKFAADTMTQGKVASLVNLMAAGGKPALAAEAELAAAAAKDPEIARIYNLVAERLARSAGISAAAASQQPQNALLSSPQ